MKNLVGRAEMLQYLASGHDTTDLADIADCFGYTYSRRKEQKRSTAPQAARVQPSKKLPEKEVILTKHFLAREPFYYLSSIEPSPLVPETSEDSPPQLPDWMLDENLPPLDTNLHARTHAALPKPQPLAPIERMRPLLRKALGTTSRKRKVDMEHLVKTVAEGHFPNKLPRRQVFGWAAKATLLRDFSSRIQVLADDYASLTTSLKELRGVTGLDVRQVHDVPGGQVSYWFGNEKKIENWRWPGSDEPVLILGDGGLLDPTGNAYRLWLDFGRRLCNLGCTATLLTPLPLRYLTAELTSIFACYTWDEKGIPQRVVSHLSHNDAMSAMEIDQKRIARELLPWLSPALLIEPELLRAIRRCLGLDSGLELLCPNHTDVLKKSLGLRIRHERLEHYRNHLFRMAGRRKELAQTIYSLFQQYHSTIYPTEFYEEIHVLANTGAIQTDALTVAAENHLKRLVKVMALANDLSVEERDKLQHYGYHFLKRQAQPTKLGQEYLSSLWAILKDQLELDDPRPAWTDPIIVSARLGETSKVREWLVRQEGEQFRIVPKSEENHKAEEESLTIGSPLFSFTTSSSLVVEEVEDAAGNRQAFDRQLSRDNGLWMEPGGGGFRLHANGKAYAISTLSLPDWAEAIGRNDQGLFIDFCLHSQTLYRSFWQSPTSTTSGKWSDFPLADIGKDKFGIYADVTMLGLTQRFRFIEPGTFLMGSPEKEQDRIEDQSQHSVTLTKGFWLADTTITQALWQKVMNDNPSRFQDNPANPVEEVSWNDVQSFLVKLNDLVPGLGARLPSEAEWEYSCRAGTTTPFSFGDNITSEQVNYDGNFPYADGEKGEYRQQTVPVKSLPANPWGLYEMHGNVWEWCRDQYVEDLGKEMADNPLHENHLEAGAPRVVRGGSWGHYGGLVRSAFRRRFGPDYRSDFLGFRLALGHAELKQVPEERAAEQRSGVGVHRCGGTERQGSSARDLAESQSIVDKAIRMIKTKFIKKQ